MIRHGDEIEVTEREAKGGSRPQGVRWVLAASLLATLLAMSAVWIFPALF